MSEELQTKYDAALQAIEELKAKLQAQTEIATDAFLKMDGAKNDLAISLKAQDRFKKSFESQQRMHDEQLKRAEQHKKNQEQAEKIIGLINVNDEQAKIEVEKLEQMKRENAIST